MREAALQRLNPDSHLLIRFGILPLEGSRNALHVEGRLREREPRLTACDHTKPMRTP